MNRYDLVLLGLILEKQRSGYDIITEVRARELDRWANLSTSTVYNRLATLEKHGALPENIHVKTVPGSFELIYGARQMTLNDGYDAVIILGSVIRGETPHFDYICQGVTEGIARLNVTSNIPVVFGLLTTNDLQQAKDRAGGRLGNKGDECAVVAIKMAKF